MWRLPSEVIAAHLIDGRVAELEVLADALASVAAGRGSAVVIRGEGGIGKTALIEAALDGCGDLVLDVRRGCAEVMDAHRPFGVLRDALGIDESGTARVQFGMAEAITDAVERACAVRPVVLVLEDLHWADTATLGVVQTLGRLVGQLPLSVVCSARPAPARDELEQVFSGLAARGAATINLGALTDDACTALVARMLGAAPGPELIDHIRAAGGNPFFVVQLASAIQVDGVPHRSPSLHMTILRHVAFLSAPTREMLGLASLLGTQFLIGDLALVTEKTVVALAPALGEASAAGILGDAGDRMAFRHQLIRDALYEEIPAAVRAELHGHMARQLSKAGVAPSRIAEHLLRATSSSDREMLMLLRDVAAALSPVAPASAVALWERALGFVGSADPLRDQLVAQLGLALFESGRPVDAEVYCRRALAAGATPELEGALLTCLTRSLLLQARIPEAAAEAERAAASPHLSPGERAAHLARLAMFPMLAGDLAAASAIATRAASDASDCGDRSARSRALVALGTVTTLQGDIDAAEIFLLEAVELEDATGDRANRDASAYPNFAMVLADADRMVEAVDMIAQARAEADQAGSAAEQFFAQQAALGVAMSTGRFDDVPAELDAVSALSQDTGIGWQIGLDAIRGLVALAREGPQAAAAFTSPDVAAPRFFSHGQAWEYLLWAELLRVTGEHALAGEKVWPGWEALDTHDVARECNVLGPALASLLCAANDVERGKRVAERLEALAAVNPAIDSIRGGALRTRGLVDDDPDLLVAAVDAYRVSPRRFEHARAAEDATGSLLRAGRTKDAEETARESLSTYAEVGAVWMAAHAHAAFRAGGLRLGVRGPRKRPATGWDALTATERRVARLVADGCSNPEVAQHLVLSRRTIESHVSHIMAKLGLRSRGEFAAHLAAYLLDDPGQDREQV